MTASCAKHSDGPAQRTKFSGRAVAPVISASAGEGKKSLVRYRLRQRELLCVQRRRRYAIRRISHH